MIALATLVLSAVSPEPAPLRAAGMEAVRL